MYEAPQSNLRLSRQKLFSRLSPSAEKKKLLPEITADVVSKPSPPLAPDFSSSSSSSFSEDDASPNVPAHAYALLATAVIALSSSGPSLDLQHDVEPTMKIYWRMTAASVVLFPFAWRSVAKEGLPKLSSLQLATFVCASLCYTIMCVGFVTSLEYTSVGNAVIFSNTNALLLLLGRFVVGSEVSVQEGVGALVAFFGGACCTLDASAMEAAPAVDEVSPPAWQGCWGDFLALCAACGGTVYLVLSKSVRARFPSTFVYLFMIMFGASWFTLAFMYLSGEEFTFSRDIQTGLFGFTHLRYDRLPLELFMVFVTNMTGTMGYLRCMKYFDPLIISVATLTEPVVASSLAFVLGEGALPGALGWFGNGLVAAGTAAVIAPRPRKKDSDLIAFSTKKLKANDN